MSTRKQANADSWILAATVLASSMVFIDVSAVNVALPVLQTDLHATNIDAQWIIEAYALFLSALILVGGSLGDHFGRRRMFLIGVIFFAAASALCGVAQTASQLIAARALQGVASAVLTPGALSIISASFSAERRGKAFGTWSSFTAISGAAGPVLGGWIVQHFSWRWIFFLNVPIAVVALAIALCWVPESKDHERVHRLDWGGAALATAGLGGLIYALITAGGSGWTTAMIGLFFIGLILLSVFVVVEKRVPSPMMPLTLFSSRNFSAVNLLTLLLYAALGGAIFFLPFDLILVQQYSPTVAGMALLPLVALLFLLSPWAGSLASSIGPKIPLVAGSAIAALALAWMALQSVGGSYWTTFFPGAVLLGLGLGLAVAPLTTTVMASVDEDHVGVASGINNAVARTAGLLAIAVLSLAVAGTFNRGLDRRLATLSLPPQILRAVDEQRPRLAAAKAPAFAPEGVRRKVEAAIKLSYVDAFRVAMLIASALAFAGSLSALLFLGGKAASASELASRSP